MGHSHSRRVGAPEPQPTITDWSSRRNDTAATDPAVQVLPRPAASIRPSKPRLLPARLSVESLLYLAIFVLATLTRFWDLGSRALHHDESLHSYYSWVFATGGGYQHDPLMHGPFLFHANALLFLIFGVTDTVTRLAPALAGVIVVMLPWLLRSDKLLGRWGALSASALLLISPSILYYSRFIRHDIYCLLGTLTLAIALLRYVERPAPRWVILGGISIGFLLCTKEVSFIVLFIFVTFVALAVVLRSAPALLGIGIGALVIFGLLDKALHSAGVAPLPGIPWEQPTNSQVWHFLISLITHPLVVGALGVLLLAIVAAVWTLDRRRGEAGWLDGILGEAPEGTTSAALRALLAEPRALLIGALLAVGIFVVFYTTLFSNLPGLISGSIGALGYWLGQQGVQRGAQPWFYFILMVPQYEFIAALCFPVATAWVVWRWWRARRARATLSLRFYLRGFLIYWSLLMLAILSWAGEKMPWLTVHIALPLTLLAASVIGEAIEWLEARARARARIRARGGWASGERRVDLALGAGVIALAGAGYLTMAWASAGPYVTVNSAAGAVLERVDRPWAAAHWWLVYLPWLALLALLVYGAYRLGAKRTLAVLALAGTLTLGLGQIHSAWRLTYREGDVPKDMLIYVQTSPYVTRVVNELQTFSRETTGGMGLEVWYDSGTQWPFNWYLRNFPNRRYFGTTLSAPPNAPIVLVSQDYLTPQMEQQLSGYTYQQYPMRWWFPEEQTYRRFAYAPDLNDPTRQDYQDSRKPPFSLLDVARSVGSSLWAMHEPQEQGKVFRLTAQRELPAPVGSYWFRVYVRNDLVRQWNALAY